MIDRLTLELVFVLYFFFCVVPGLCVSIAIFNKLDALQKQLDFQIKKYPNERP